MPEVVVLVDEYGRDVPGSSGQPATMEKMQVHRLGLLHRAVSVFVFNEKNELLLQQRSAVKYHSPGKWSNTCCTHCLPGEGPLDTARRRLAEEMGMSVALEEICTISYRVDAGEGLVESEFDHVFFGFSNQDPQPDPAEVSGWEWSAAGTLERELVRYPDKYSAWFHHLFKWLSGQSLYPA